MGTTITTNYGKVFNSLCHFMALSQTVNIKTVLDNLVISAIALDKQTNAITFQEISDAIEVYFGTEITQQDLIESINRLVSDNKLIVEPDNRYRLIGKVVADVNAKVQSSKSLENRVRDEWLDEISRTTDIQKSGDKSFDISSLWEVLQNYLAKSFYRHGAQTIQILDPTFTVDGGVTANLSALLQEAIRESKAPIPESLIKNSIRHFLGTQTPDRVAYLAELLDGTFTFFALNVDDAISSYLSGAFQPLKIFLDTNFIFGILNLHNNQLVTVSHELVDVISQYFPQITLYYHVATIDEMQRAIQYIGEQLLARKWSTSLSRAGTSTSQLTGLNLKYHEQNAQSKTPLDPTIFLQKYQNPIPILTEHGFHIYETMPSIDVETKGQLIAEYQSYIERRRQPKSYRVYDHDMVVLLAAEENRDFKSSFSVLDAGALILTCDYYLYSFDRYERKAGRVGSVVLPNHLLQMLRPLIPRSPDFDERFVSTFAIPEFRSIDSDYAATVSKVMMYLATFEDLSEASAVRILSDNVLIQKLNGISEDSEEFANSVENALAQENEELIEEIATLKSEIAQITETKQQIEKESNTQIEILRQEKDEIEKKSLEKLQQNEQMHLQKLKTIKANLDKGAREYGKRILVLGVIFAVIIILVTYVFVSLFDWVQVEVAFIIEFVLLVCTYLFFAFTEKELSPKSLFEIIVNNKKLKFYKQYGVELETLDRADKNSPND